MFYRFLASHAQRQALLRTTLLSVALLDELIAGFPVIGLPLIRDQLGLSYTQIGLLFGIAGMVAMLLEPIINLLSDRGSKRSWIVISALIGAAGFLLKGLAWNFAMLLIAFVITSPANSATVGLSQAALIDQQPQESTRAMTRWTLAGSFGDILAPLVVTLVVALHGGWPALCWITAGVWLWTALSLGLQRFPRPIVASDEDAAQQAPLISGLREALRDPALLRWATLSIIPSMVDEIFLGFAALYMRDILHASQNSIDLAIGLGLIGSLLSLLCLERIAWFRRIAPQHFLVGAACVVLLGVVGFLSLHNIWCAAVTLFIINLGAAGWYPIAKAQAYARFPGRSGTVRAVISLGGPFEVALPGIVGIVAGSFGIVAGVGILALAPVFILLLTLGYKAE